MKGPVIAMPQMGTDLFRKYMKHKYVRSVQRAGGCVRWIELEDPQAAVAQMLECDGLLLPGGADVAPKYYGQTPTEKCGKPNVLRDTGEMAMLEAFLLTKKPILCICRGMQLLNVFCGGSLHQDIKEIQECKHSDFGSRATSCHSVTVLPETRLGRILGTGSIPVNSMHHQAADRIGQDLTVSARSEDGFVEAVEYRGHPFCIGVQWHPEHMSGRSETQQAIFQAFVDACK